MTAKMKPKIIISHGEDEMKIEPVPAKIKGKMKVPRYGSDFEPRLKKPGDLILSEEWNDIQEEIKGDLTNIVCALEDAATRSSTIIASGIASHGVFVELNWDVRPHVILSPGGTINGGEGKTNLFCYPHDLSSKGFRVFSQTRDGKTSGIVNWIAIGTA